MLEGVKEIYARQQLQIDLGSALVTVRRHNLLVGMKASMSLVIA